MARRNYVKRAFRGSRKTVKKYGKAFWTRKGKYGRYVYRQGRRIAFDTFTLPGKWYDARSAGLQDHWNT